MKYGILGTGDVACMIGGNLLEWHVISRCLVHFGLLYTISSDT